MPIADPDHAAYFDHAASAPPFPEALEAQARAARDCFGNPSAAHGPGAAARAEVERLRARLMELCGFSGGRLVLTSGATEANNLVVHGVLARFPAGRVLVAEDVHASLWNACHRHAGRVDVLRLDAGGRIALPALGSALGSTPRAGTRLFCCAHAANETGIIHDAAAIASLCERRGVLCLVDGSQTVGHVPVDLSALACDFFTFASHKFGGPRGSGGLFLRATELVPSMDGGAQEWGLRPGTENLGALAGAATALEMALAALPAEAERLRALARSVVDGLRSAGTPFDVNGDPDRGLPGLLSLSFEGLDGHALVADLALQGYAVGAGSACSADRPEPSRAILALGRTPRAALGTIRISFGRTNSAGTVREFIRALVATVARLRVER